MGFPAEHNQCCMIVGICYLSDFMFFLKSTRFQGTVPIPTPIAAQATHPSPAPIQQVLQGQRIRLGDAVWFGKTGDQGPWDTNGISIPWVLFSKYKTIQFLIGAFWIKYQLLAMLTSKTSSWYPSPFLPSQRPQPPWLLSAQVER